MRALKRLCLLLALVLSCAGCAKTEERAQEVRLLFLNVGKADAAILSVDDRRYLIDAGDEEDWPVLAAAFESAGVQALQGVFLSHAHKDHAGGLVPLAQSDIEVEAWYAPALYTLKKNRRHPMAAAAALRGDEVHFLESGAQIDLGGGCKLQALAPLELDEKEENNNSLVLRLTTPYGGALFTGDMLLDEEEALLQSGADLSCDVIKIAHHGGGDATSRQLIEAAGPEYALISTSTAERAETPAPRVISLLQEQGAQTFVTQDHAAGVEFVFSAAGISAAGVSQA